MKPLGPGSLTRACARSSRNWCLCSSCLLRWRQPKLARKPLRPAGLCPGAPSHARRSHTKQAKHLEYCPASPTAPVFPSGYPPKGEGRPSMTSQPQTHSMTECRLATWPPRISLRISRWASGEHQSLFKGRPDRNCHSQGYRRRQKPLLEVIAPPQTRVADQYECTRSNYVPLLSSIQRMDTC